MNHIALSVLVRPGLVLALLALAKVLSKLIWFAIPAGRVREALYRERR